MRHFKAHEFSDFGAMKVPMLEMLDQARQIAGVPFKITSSYRDGDKKSHGRGWAVDIACTASRDRYHILTGLLAAGFTRVGVYDRHIHADADPTLDQEVMWWGTSK